MQVPFSVEERQNNVSRLYALAHRFGTMASFLTVSFDDAHNPLVLRMSVPGRSDVNTSFPAIPGDLMAKLRDPAATEGPGGIKLANVELHKRVASNPVAATVGFLRQMTNVSTYLIGKAPDTGALSTKPARTGCLGGRVTAIGGCVETQGRGTLHAHMLLCGLLGTDVVQAGAKHPKVAAAVCEWVDATFCADLDIKQHLLAEARKLLNEPTTRTAFLDVPFYDPRPGSPWWRRVTGTQEQAGIHTHHPGCWRKGECRFALPHPPRECTQCLSLRISMANNGKELAADPVAVDDIPHEDYDGRRDRSRRLDPLPRPDLRPIVLEPRNPSLLDPAFDGKITWDDLMNDDDVRNDPDLQAVLGELDERGRQRLVSRLPRRNQMVVCINRVITGCTGVNTAYLLHGASTQAKSALYYTVRATPAPSTTTPPAHL